MAQQHSPNAENGSEEHFPAYLLPLEVQEMVGNQMVQRVLIDLSVRENIDTPAVALALPHVYQTYYRHNWFIVSATCRQEGQAVLDDWIWGRLNSRMMHELAHPSVGPQLIIQVAIVATNAYPVGPGEWQNDEGPGAVRIREDPESIYRLFAVVRRFKEKTSRAVDMRYILTTEREGSLIDGQRENACTKCIMPDPIIGHVRQICEHAVYNELIPMLETTNGAPSAAALTLADNYLPTDDPAPAWAAGLINPDPEVSQVQQAVVNDPAMKIGYAIKYLRRSVAEQIFLIIHINTSAANYDTLLQASDFGDAV